MSSIQIKASIEADKTLPRFTMTAYTGAEMQICGFSTPVVVDVAGIQIPYQKVPILSEHNKESPVGHTEEILVIDGELVASGVFSHETEDAFEVASSLKNGYPWQASIGGEVIQSDLIESGTTVFVNGKEFVGPVTIVRSMVLKEISVVVFGADDGTSVVAASRCKDSTVLDIPDKVNGVCMEVQKEIQDYREMLAVDAERCAVIHQISNGKYPDIEAKAIREGWTIEKVEIEVGRAELKAKEAELDAIRSSRPDVPISSVKEASNNDVLECIALRAAGVSSSVLEKKYSDSVLEAAYKRRGMGLQEFCASAAQDSLPRYRSDSTGWLRAAFSNANIGGLLSNVANKALQEGYLYAEDAWRSICKITSVPDFKTAYRYRLDPSLGFTKIPAGGEIPNGSISDANYTNKANTYGVMFSIDRQMIINDDLGALGEIPRQIGVAAAESIADTVWTILLANGNAADGKAFFHADHGNLVTGASYVLSLDGLDKAYSTFLAKTKPNGKPLGARPTILLVPGCLAATASTLMTSATVNNGTAKATPVVNPFNGKFGVVASSYLDNASMSGYSTTAWYLFADPERVPTVEVAFLNGNDRPVIEQSEADFNTLGIKFRGYTDYGVALGDWRGAVKVTGTN